MGIVTAIPNGPRILDLRQKKYLTQEALAAKSGISPRRLRDLEKGLPALPTTIRLLARALEVEFDDLLANTNPLTIPPSPTREKGTKFVRLELVLNLKFNDIDEHIDLVQRLNALLEVLGSANAVKIGAVTEGSTVIETYLNHGDTKSLVEAFVYRRSVNLELRSIRILANYHRISQREFGFDDFYLATYPIVRTTSGEDFLHKPLTPMLRRHLNSRLRGWASARGVKLIAADILTLRYSVLRPAESLSAIE